eukprot:jgi/Ulvmu1/2878/UM146_0020.1
MANWKLAAAALLIGCHVANCTRQDRFVDAGWADGITDSQAPQPHDLHPISTLVDALYDDDSACSGMCNDEELHPDGEPHFYECWGKFKWVCNYSGDDADTKAKAATEYYCDGAFTYFPGPTDSQSMGFDEMPGLAGMADDSDDNKTFMMSTCEGNALTFTKTVAEVPTENLKGKTKVKVVQGIACSGHLRVIASEATEGTEIFVGCEDAMVSGTATKISTTSQAAEDSEAANWDAAAELLTDHLTDEWLSWSWADKEAGPDASGKPASGEQERVTNDDGDAVFPADMHAAAGSAASQQMMMSDWAFGGRAPAGCRWTCNKGSLPLHGWWPCRGKLELKCKGDAGGTKYKVDLECVGVSCPVFKTCKGLATGHFETENDMVATETIFITKGKTRTIRSKRHGWNAKLSVGLGLSSLHSRIVQE